MKGVPGLLVALGLGIAGAACNWFYMAQKAAGLEIVQFVGIREGGVKAGQIFKSEHLVPVPIPRQHALRLIDSALPYTDVPTIVGTTAYRDFREGEIILRQDLAAPPSSDLREELGPDEEAISIPVDGRGFVPSLFSPGHEVSFIVPRSGSAAPGTPGRGSVETEKIGPFFILAIGTRRGSFDRARAAGTSQAQENIVTIRVKKLNDKEFDSKTEQLLSRLRATGGQALGIVMHPKRREI
jgi:hypothetical protein